MAAKSKILCVGNPSLLDAKLVDHLHDSYEVVQVGSAIRALAKLTRGKFAGIYIVSQHFEDGLPLGRLLQNEQFLEGMPDGAALLNADNTILWVNAQLLHWCESEDSIVGSDFYNVFRGPEILGYEYCPFHAALATGQPSNSTLRTRENRYFQIHAAPVFDGRTKPEHLIVTIRDVTKEQLQQQKMAAIHKAGIELADLTTEEVFNMEVEDRIELLKSNIFVKYIFSINFWTNYNLKSSKPNAANP